MSLSLAVHDLTRCGWWHERRGDRVAVTCPGCGGLAYLSESPDWPAPAPVVDGVLPCGHEPGHGGRCATNGCRVDAVLLPARVALSCACGADVLALAAAVHPEVAATLAESPGTVPDYLVGWPSRVTPADAPHPAALLVLTATRPVDLWSDGRHGPRTYASPCPTCQPEPPAFPDWSGRFTAEDDEPRAWCLHGCALTPAALLRGPYPAGKSPAQPAGTTPANAPGGAADA